MKDVRKVHKTLEGEGVRISYREGITENEQIFESHTHTRYEVIAVFEGKVSIIVDNKRFSLSAGEIALIPPLVYHSVFVGGETLYKRATLLFDSKLIPEEISEDFKEKIRRFPISAHNELRSVFSGIKSIFEYTEEDGKKFIPLTKSYLIEILYLHTYKDGSEKNEKIHPTVKAATEYVEANITSRLTLDDIAAGLYLSKSTVCHVFKSEMKISLKQYVLQKKLVYSAKLMREGVSAAAAAAAIGYDNYASFYKMHKKILGETPRMKKT